MDKRFNKKCIKKSSGFSLIEVMVTTALIGFIAFSVSTLMKQSTSLKKETESNTEIDQAFKNIQSILSYSDNNNSCELLLAGGLNKTNIVVQSANGNLGPYGNGSRLGNSTTRVLSIDTNQAGDTGQGKTRVRVIVTFEKKVEEETRTIQKSFVRPVVVDGSTVSCLPVDGALVNEQTLAEVCSEVGGTVSGTDCNVDSGSLSNTMQERLRQFACSMFGDMNNYTSGLCNEITVTDHAQGTNIAPGFICINGSACRNQFDTSACSSNQYLSEMNNEGQRSCKSIVFNGQANSCVIDCSCAATTPVGGNCDNGCGGTCPGTQTTTPTPSCTPNCACAAGVNANSSCSNGCGGTCPGLRCDFLDSYSKVGGNCRFRDYSPTTSNPGSCSNFSDSMTNTPECKQLVSFSCSGSTEPSYVNVADGTGCGTNKECNNGMCEDVVQGCSITSAISFCGNASTSTAFTPAGPPVNVPFNMPNGATYSLADIPSLRSATLSCNNGSVTVGSCTTGNLNLQIENVGGETGPNGNYTD